MKKAVKLLPLLCAAASCTPFLCGMTAYAADAQPVSVSIEADKDAYSKGDSLKFNVSVSNNSDSEISDISLKASLPDTFTISENGEYSLSLDANETKSYIVAAEAVTTEATSTTTSQKTTTTKSATTTKSTGTTKSEGGPKTGDTPPYIFMLVLPAAVFLAVKSKKNRKAMSVLITAVVFGSLTMQNISMVTDAASKPEEITATADFNYDSITETITVTAKYEILSPLTVDTAGLEKKDDDTYRKTDDFSALSGKLEKADNIKALTAETYDRSGEKLHTAEIAPAAEWSADDLGLAEGYNKVVLRAESSDGKTYEEELVIFVPQVLDYNKQALRDVTGVSNARQLGGYINTEGRKIKENVLLRTANLSHITEGGIAALQNKYKVSDIMDLRYDRELNAHTTDKEIAGITHHSIPMSATKDTAAEVFSKNPDLFAKMQELQKNAGTPEGSIALSIFQAEVGVINVQKHIEYFESDEAAGYYRDVFDIFLNKPEDAAVLFHCAGGKDRTGMVSMLILAALDFDKDIMLQDYMLTNVANAEKIEQTRAAAEAYTDDPDLRYNIIYTAAVYQEVMEQNIDDLTEQYGSVKNFLREKVGLTDDDFAKLKALYLED